MFSVYTVHVGEEKFRLPLLSGDKKQNKHAEKINLYNKYEPFFTTKHTFHLFISVQTLEFYFHQVLKIFIHATTL